MTAPLLALLRQQLGQCPRCGAPTSVHVCCPRCRSRMAAQYQLTHPKPGPHRIAHCGAWYQLATLPWTCPTCHTTLGTPQQEAP
jgi:hypothetical protein